MSSTRCPTDLTLSSWLDGELDDQGQRIRGHVESCERCTQLASGWLDVARSFASLAARSRAVAEGIISSAASGDPSEGDDCPDFEDLLVYSEAAPGVAGEAPLERHLALCGRCVEEVRRLVRLRMMLGDAVSVEPAERPEMGRSWRAVVTGSLATWIRRFAFGRPLAASAAAGVLVAFAIAGMLRTAEPALRYRGAAGQIGMQVVAEGIEARARPGDDHPVVAVLGQGTVVKHLETSGDWTRVELDDGRRVWLQSSAVSFREGASQ